MPMVKGIAGRRWAAVAAAGNETRFLGAEGATLGLELPIVGRRRGVIGPYAGAIKRWLAALVLIASGCSEYSRSAALQGAEALLLAGVFLAAGAAASAVPGAADRGSGSASPPPGRLVRATARHDCPDGRSYVLMCYDYQVCYFETNEGRDFQPEPGDPTQRWRAPSPLLDWCASGITPPR
jgi:hypothetical protein